MERSTVEFKNVSPQRSGAGPVQQAERVTTDGWRSLGTLLPAWLAMAWLVSKAQWQWSNRPELQFGWIVLMLCAFLWWEAWEKKPAFVFRWKWETTIGLVLGGALVFVFQLYQAAFGLNAASLLGLALGTMLLAAANVHYVFGWPGVKHFAFGFGFLLLALPMPSVLHNLIVGGLQGKIAFLNVEILNLTGVAAERVGSLIRLPNCVVGVDEACSGIRSLQSTVMATLFIGYLTLKKTSLRITLLFAGVALALFGNLIRSLFLSYSANARGVEAIEAAHDAAGWSILAFTAVGVMALAWLMAKLERHAASLQAARPPLGA